MRRTRSATTLVVSSITLSVVMVLTGCSGSGSEDPRATATTSATSVPSPRSLDIDDEGDQTGTEPEDTFAGGSVPVTVDVPVGDLPGFAQVRFWKGSDLLPGPRMNTGGLTLDEGELAVQVSSVEAAITEDTAEAQMRYWRRNNGVTAEPAELLDPVVVDGVEMLHARGESGFQHYDYFLRLADNGDELSLLFSLPQEMAHSDREDYIASVMAEIEFA